MAQVLGLNQGTCVMCVLVLLNGVHVRSRCRTVRQSMKGFVSTLADTVRQDLRYGVRMMRRGPMLAVTAVATVALSTAAIATVATLADTLLWRQLPVDDARTLVSVTATRGHLRPDGAISYPDYVAFRDRATTVQLARRALFDRAALRRGRGQCGRGQRRGRLGELLSAFRDAPGARPLLPRR